MKPLLTVLAALLATSQALAGPPADFTGRWTLNPSRSTNLGMMATMSYTAVITQTPQTVVIHNETGMMGQTQSQEVHYALSGEPTSNADYMGQSAQTVTHWDGAKLVTTWKSAGAVAGTTTVRTETRSISSDGKSMTLESVTGSKSPRVFVFDRK
jgi:hypothetical protein